MLKYHFHLTCCHGNMSTLEETPSVSEPIKENNPPAVSEPIEENNPMETTVKSKKPTPKSYRQKLQQSRHASSIVKKPSKDSEIISRREHFLNGSNHYVPSQKWNHPKLKL